MVIAVSTPVISPEVEVDNALTEMSGPSGFNIGGTHKVAGHGGVVKCGDGRVRGEALAVCTWANNGSVGIMASFFEKSSSAEAQLVAQRAQIETRG